ncbi:MAG: FAD-binding oxidoreductase [Methyloligellaceae bacterium]
MPIALAKADKKILAKRRAITNGLRKLIGKDRIIADDVGRMVFSSDALQAYRQVPLLVVLPESTREVATVLKYCSEKGIKVVPRGAGTSVTGSALPSEDSIVICLSRMDKVLTVNYEDRIARVQAGVTNQGITDAVAGNGFFYAPDPSSKVACTIAGNIATNAGGPGCLKYGMTSNNVLGLKLVTIDGEVLELGGSYLDPMEYDLRSLILGSEGQLGIVTEATVRILPRPESSRPILIGFASPVTAAACVGAIVSSGIMPVSLEYMDRAAIQICEEFAQAGYPANAEALLIVEVEGSPVEIDRKLADINKIARNHEPIIVKISENDHESAEIWKGRNTIAGAIGRISDFYVVDGAIPTGMLPQVLEEVSGICRKYELRVANIFHAGDGNLHSLVLYDANNPQEVEKVEAAGAEILKYCVKVGGSLTGEHGIGIEKRDLMPEQFTEHELMLQMRIKDAFDPDWLLNPGKVFPLEMHR